MDLENALIYFINDGILASKSNSTLQSYKKAVSSLLKYIRLNFLSQAVADINIQIISNYFLEGIKIKKWSRYSHWIQYRNLKRYYQAWEYRQQGKKLRVIAKIMGYKSKEWL